MIRKRLITATILVGLGGVALTALMAAREAGDKSSDSPAKAAGTKKLVCIGNVDTEEPVVRILPDNFPMPSKVTAVLVHEGDKVTKGQELLRFDTETLALKVEEADIAIAAAQKDLEKAQAIVRGHKPQVEAAEKELMAKEAELEAKKEELAEAKRAAKAGNRNEVELKAFDAAVKAAEFNLQAVRIKWEALKPEAPTYLADLARENVRKSQNAKAQAEHALKQVACTAPADGQILRSYVSEGLNFGMHTKDPAFWFLKESPRIVRAEVTQEFARRVSQGQTAVIEDEADKDQQWQGKVIKVPDQFLPKRLGNTGMFDLMPVSDERVLECQVSINLIPGKTPPRFGQKVRVTIGE